MTTPPVTVRNYAISAQSTDTFGRVLVSARDHHFVMDGPVQNGCPGEEVTPPEFFLSSVAACGVELVQVIAKETGKTVGKVNLAVHGTVDRGNQKRAGVTVFNAVRMEFSVGGTDGATAAELVEAFKRR